MQDLISALERLLLCESLTNAQRDVAERCLDEGYEPLSAEDKSQIRRMLNRQAASPGGALKRWRERKQQEAARKHPHEQPTTRASRRVQH